jgi:hypothetical protein
MSLQLTFGGGEILLVRDKGTANVVQGFVSREVTVSKNIVQLPTTFIFQLYGYIQIPLSEAAKFWVKVSSTWRAATAYVKISGAWKTVTPHIKITGNWK